MNTPDEPTTPTGETPPDGPTPPASGGGRRRAAGPSDSTQPPTAPRPGRRARILAPGEDPDTGAIALPVLPEAPSAEPVPLGGPQPVAQTQSESQREPESEPEPATENRSRVAVGRRRIDPVLLLACAVPLVAVAALSTVDPAPTESSQRPPGTAELSRTLLVCPAGLPGSEDVSAALADPQASGTLRVTDQGGLAVAAGKVATRRSAKTVVLEGSDQAAVGLVAVRGDAALGTACQPPRSDVWFTGVGAGPEHTSTLRLVNPDAGPAVADVEVLTADGPLEVKALRGLAVGAHQETTVELDQVVPEREDMSIRVTVPRGRLALSMTDTFSEIGSDVRARSWLGAQRAGTRTTHLLGVERGAGRRTLVLANAGSDEARVKINLVTEKSEFAPTGVEEVTVAPGSTRTVELGNLLSSKQAEGVVGLRLDSEVPVTATLRTVRGKRVQHTVGASRISSTAATVVAGGGGALVVGGAENDTEVTVLQRTASGKALEAVTRKLTAGTSARITLSSKAGFVTLEVKGAPVRAAVVAGVGDPAQVRVLDELATVASVPDVRPALK